MEFCSTGRAEEDKTVVEEISSLAALEAREVVFVQCSRWQNNASHVLAAYGRSTPRTAVWFAGGPDFLVNLVMAEMPP